METGTLTNVYMSTSHTDSLYELISWHGSNNTSATLSDDCTYTTGWKLVKEEWHRSTPHSRLREIIASRLSPAIHVRGSQIGSHHSPAEQRARHTLKMLVGEQQWRRFLKHGFVTVRAKSGRTYQIFHGSRFTRVWTNHKLTHCLCVVLPGGYPPTDQTIVRYLMLANDEDGFWQLAIEQGLPKARPQLAQPARSLVDEFVLLKA